MAGPNMEALAAKCVWKGDYTYWTEKPPPLNEFTVGLVTLDQVITLLKKAKYLAREVNDWEAKFVGINWKALAGFLHEKGFEDWRVTP